MKRGAVLAFGDEARLQLERVRYGPGDEAAFAREALFGRAPRTAAWLMCNPSRADHEQDDPTMGRVLHHSANLGCDRVLVGNVWCLRTHDPAVMWSALRNGRYSPEMHGANLDALAIMGAQADVFVVAFGAAPWRSHRAACIEALRAWLPNDRVPLCLGVTDDGAPLHPLARGKFAVRNDTVPYDWPGVREL
jgi:hypothetical protein